MTTHELKTEASFWDAVKSGDKTFEIRRNDRGFQKGDMLLLQKMRSLNIPTLDEPLKREVTYVLNGYGIENGFVVLGIKETT